MFKIGIVGSNGYISRNLYQHLNKKGISSEIKLYDIDEYSIDGVQNYSQINILNKQDINKIDYDCDILFFMVGKTGTRAGFDDYEMFVSINEIGLLNFIDEYRKQKSKAKIIFPSTRLIYKGSNLPLKEDAPKESKTIYAINKYACENYLSMYSVMFDIKYCIFRICVPYGTMIEGASSYGTAEFMIKNAIEQKKITIYGDGEIRRTFTHINDLCEAMITGAVSDKCVNDVFNIGGENHSLKEMAEMVASKYGASIEYVPWPDNALKIESGSTVFNDDKFVHATGFEYQFSFKEWNM